MGERLTERLVAAGIVFRVTREEKAD
jgi:hypothetical protein